MMIFKIRTFHQFFFFLLIAFLPTQLGYHFWPEWAVVLGRRVDYLSPTFYVTDVLIIFMILTWIVPQRNKISTLTAAFRSNTYLVIAILSLLIINIAFSQQFLLAISGWLKLLECSMLILYIKKTKPSLFSIFMFFSVTMFVSCLLGIAQTVHGGSLGGIWWFFGERTFSLQTPGIAKGVICLPTTFSCIEYLRPYATFPHPNVFAGFLAVYTTVGIQLFARKFSTMTTSSYTFRGYLFFSGVLSVLTLILTFSRSAWTILCMMILLLIFRSRPRIFNVFFLFFTCLLVIISILLLSPLPFLDRESVDVRVLLNHTAIKLFYSHPLTGVGLKNLLFSLPSFLPSRSIYFLQPVHNIYLLALSETGLLGLVTTLSILWEKRHYFVKRLLFPPLLLLLSIGLFDHYTLTLQQGQLLFSVIIALSFYAPETLVFKLRNS